MRSTCMLPMHFGTSPTVSRLSRRPGQKEVRYRQLLGDDGAPELPREPDERTPNVEDRLAALEERVRRLEDHTGVQPL